MKAKWLDQTLVQNPLHVGVCLTEKAFTKVLKRLGVDKRTWPEFIPAGAHAVVHYLENFDTAEKIVILCIRRAKQRSRNEVAALLAHECVHIWQYIREYLNEKEPSSEFEAYAIQNLLLRVLNAYDEGTS